MKKNITVNIFGSLYPMDEDAYAMLNAYLINMREYFSKKPDGKEIADDIEARAAELMSELMHSGVEAISIEHINEIITRIGNPEQMNYDEENPALNSTATDDTKDTSESSEVVKKKLFRDPDHKIIAGVCSGLGNYFGINPVWLRIIGLALIWPTFGVIIAVYAICWICIPLAVTPTERLQMKGEPVNMSNICREFLESTREMINKTGTFANNNGFSYGIVSIIKWVMYSLCILLGVAFILAILGILISLVSAVSAPWANLTGIIKDEFPLYAVSISNPLWLIAVCGISLLVMLILMLYGIIHFVFHILGKVKPMSIVLRVSCVTLWIIGLIVFVASSINIVSNVGIEYGPRSYAAAKEREAANVLRQREFLESQGWTIARENNLKGGYTRSDKHYSGNDDIRFLHAGSKDNDKVMEYEVVKHVKVAPGVYRLKAAGRTNGEGAEIFAENGNGIRFASPIPVCANSGGSIWQNAKDALEADTLKKRPDRGYLNKIYKANDKHGYGWSEIVVDNIKVGPDSILTYGVTNVGTAHPWEGSWFSATSFELQKDL